MFKETKNFYNKTRLHKEDLEDSLEEISNITHVEVFRKSYPRLPLIKISDVEREDSEFENLLDYRESHRIFSDSPISFGALSKILGSCRIVDTGRKPERRSYPSGGARFPVELYIVSYNVENLEKGAYHYNMKGNYLELLLGQDLNNKRRELVSPYLENPAVTILFTSVLARSEVKYGLRAYPYSLIEAGHMGQNIQLAASEIGIGSCPVNGFIDDTVKKTLDLTDDEIPIYSISIGKVKKG
jgi:SagB-type dehydrogenase family enzyme